MRGVGQAEALAGAIPLSVGAALGVQVADVGGLGIAPTQRVDPLAELGDADFGTQVVAARLLGLDDAFELVDQQSGAGEQGVEPGRGGQGARLLRELSGLGISSGERPLATDTAQLGPGRPSRSASSTSEWNSRR